MQIICVSRAVFSGGESLGKSLAKKLGYASVSREDLIVAAREQGINVGKLEMSMLKPGIFTEQMALLREHYLAFCQVYLCGKAKEGPMVYHGRTGHLLLPGVSHVLRVRVLADMEQRIALAMKDLNLERGKAARYIEQVDEDWRCWARAMYGVSWEDSAHYDMVLNLEQMGVENAASALVEVAQLPSFRMTPASGKALEDLYLAARARLALAGDEATAGSGFQVRAESGAVTVTLLPHNSRYEEKVPEVLKPVEGIREIHTTLATTNVLWIQERYDTDSETFKNLVEIASKWNAAVELMRLAPTEAAAGQAGAGPGAVSGKGENGGIEDDEEEVPAEGGGMRATLDALARLGCSGGGRAAAGGAKGILQKLDRNSPYSLVVVGDVYLDKSHAVRQRMARDLLSTLSDHIKAPVVAVDQLKAQYLFGKRDAGMLAGSLGLVAALFLLVFTNQEAICGLLSRTGWQARLLEAVAVFLFMPVVAFAYGKVAGSVMKLIKMD